VVHIQLVQQNAMTFYCTLRSDVQPKLKFCNFKLQSVKNHLLGTPKIFYAKVMAKNMQHCNGHIFHRKYGATKPNMLSHTLCLKSLWIMQN